ncbi:MAG: MFS transporter [Candidatus Paceibacterota bacterium]|jgi:hypothetical protein
MFKNLRRSSLFILYIIGFLFAFRTAIPSYIDSSFLSSLFGERLMSVVFILCSVLILCIFAYIPNILKAFGNYKTTIFLSITDIISVIGLVFFHDPLLLLLSFVINYTTIVTILLCLDVFIEHNSENKDTGKIRAIYLTSVNTAWLASPWIASLFVGESSYWRVYAVSGAIMIPIILLISSKLKGFVDAEYKDFNFIKTLKEVWKKKDIECILASNFLLQFFFACMVIYMPIYLNRYIGFDWKTIGIIFTIMLLPFVLIQIPLGRLADKRLGEKEMLNIGFLIMAISTVVIPFIDGKNFWVWAIVLFMTRVGAATVQVMNDVYFFKNVSEKNVNLISLYRAMASLAYVIAPLVVIVWLIYMPLSSLFLFLGFLMLFGLYYGLAIHDTK